jgi:hypothetical protein
MSYVCGSLNWGLHMIIICLLWPGEVALAGRSGAWPGEVARWPGEVALAGKSGALL